MYGANPRIALLLSHICTADFPCTRLGVLNRKPCLTIGIDLHCSLQSLRLFDEKVHNACKNKGGRALNAASGGSALEWYCAQDGGAAGDRITTLLSLGAGAAPGRQLSRWSACSKLSPPPYKKKEAARALLRPLFFEAGGGVWQGWLSLPSVPSWRPLYYCFTEKTR